MSEEPQLPEELEPSRYIERVSLITGEVLDRPILPKQLLVQNHRDYHVVDVHARFMMSRVVKETGSEDEARRRMKGMRDLGKKTAGVVAKAIGEEDSTKVSKALFGLKDKEYYFRFKQDHFTAEDVAAKISALRAEARAKFEAASVLGDSSLRVLLTGGTGFVGKEVIWQVANDEAIAEVVVVIRPKVIRDWKTKEIVKTLSPAERGEMLLDQLWLEAPEQRFKFRFVAGDVEKLNLGISDEELSKLEKTITHVVHSAASVAFDDPYETSFRANVSGTLNALRFSHRLQNAQGSPFVAHLGIETSYIHGRQSRQQAREDEIVFPRNFYNNYYELTKAMASIETERFMLDKGLRVVQLCPAIVIGESKAGNNRGDSKVLNAPVNLFGRASQSLKEIKGGWVDRSKGAMLARMACIFPGDPSAEINLIPVDRVAAGIVAALKTPAAVGERVHLATDNRLTSERIVQIVREELDVNVKLAEPTLHRTVTLPALSKVLSKLGQERIANALNKLGNIFGGYSEWGQPVHEVGGDVEILGLTDQRPDTEHVFRMLCRHNRFVQDYGQVRDLDEISRREKIWSEFVDDVERLTGRPAGALSAEEFGSLMDFGLDLESFVRRTSAETSDSAD